MTWSMLAYAALDTALLVLSAAVIAGLFALAALGLCRLLLAAAATADYRHVLAEFFVVAMPFAVVGVMAGFLTGISRSPAVSATVPALLTLFGGLVAYLMTKGRASALLAGTAIVAFSISVLYGTIAGSHVRGAAVAETSSIRSQQRQADRELAIEIYRRSLGLPPLAEKSKAPAKDKD
jgi:hypothetical protein